MLIFKAKGHKKVKYTFLFGISQFSTILKRFLCFALWVCFCSREKEIFPFYVAYNVLMNSCLVVRTLYTGTQMYSNQRLRENELDIWLIPSHGATWPPSNSCKNFIRSSPSPLVLEDCLLVHRGEFGHFLFF